MLALTLDTVTVTAAPDTFKPPYEFSWSTSARGALFRGEYGAWYSTVPHSLRRT